MASFKIPIHNINKHRICLLFPLNSFNLYCRNVTVKNMESGEVTVIYNAKENIWRLRTPIVQDLKVQYFP